MIFRNTQGKVVGFTENNRYLTTRKPIHFFRAFSGFAISQHIIDKLEEIGISEIVIKYEGKKGTAIFTSSLSQWLDAEIYTYEFDEQRVLSISVMRRD